MSIAVLSLTLVLGWLWLVWPAWCPRADYPHMIASQALRPHGYYILVSSSKRPFERGFLSCVFHFQVSIITFYQVARTSPRANAFTACPLHLFSVYLHISSLFACSHMSRHLMKAIASEWATKPPSPNCFLTFCCHIIQSYQRLTAQHPPSPISTFATGPAVIPSVPFCTRQISTYPNGYSENAIHSSLNGAGMV